MTWTIILENEDKSVVLSLSDEFYISSSDSLKGLKLLRYLDPYGDTIFNRLQMDDLIQDLQYLGGIENNSLINEIQLLGEHCKMEPHTYLAFYGD